MQLVLATYERFLLGYKLPDQLEGPCDLQRSFTHAAHQGPVRCLDAGGPWVVSGGQDDQLHIYDVKAGRDLGFMMNPGDGAITCVKLFTPPGSLRPSHLLSGSEDGSIAVWRAGGDWEALKLLRGHKGPVRSVAVHPSGLLALSVGHDRLIKLWNLSKGRPAYSARLEAEADEVAFSADGESYALLCDRLISLHAVAAEGAAAAAGGGVTQLKHTRRVTALLHPPPAIAATAAAGGGDGAAPSPLLLSGCDDGRLCLWDVRAGSSPVLEVSKAHNARVRAITAVTPGESASALPLHLATASSDGVVKLWDSRNLGSSSNNGSSGGSSEALQLLASVSTNGRITGMVLSAPERGPAAAAAAGAAAEAAGKAPKAKKAKRKKQQEQQPEEQQQQQQQQPPARQKQPKQQRQKQQQQQRQQQKQLQQQQQQQQQQPKQKQKQKQKLKQQQRDADDDFEVVPADAEMQPAQQDQGVQQQHKQHKQQQHKQAEKLDKHKQKQQQRRRRQQQQQQQQHGGAGGGSDTALVPRVTTVIKKKKKQQRPAAAAAGAAAGGSRKPTGSGSKKKTGSKQR